MNRTRTAALSTLALALPLALSACTSGPSSVAADQSHTNSQLSTFQANQPIPYNTWSQYRQTVIDVEQAEIHGVATTTFFYNQGSAKPIKSCPSIGFPVAADAQLTNPQQALTDGNGNPTVTVGQQEPNGVYTGGGTGTYVVCVGAGGVKRIDYWEGYVETEGGSASIGPDGQIADTGSTSVTSTGKK